MRHFAIIADDLSSATDCGAQVVRSGLSVVVPLKDYSLPPQARDVQVLSVDTDSRSLLADQAYAKVKAAAQQLVAEGWTDFYKSVDSTLRGNLGAEIEAVVEVVQPDCTIIAPAFPKYGRTTVDGVQYLHGLPLHETEFGTDPTAPVKNADIAKRLSEETHRKIGQLTLDSLRARPSQIKSALRDLLADGVEMVVVDIDEQDDLKRLCLGLWQSNLNVLWVGSTGMAEFVPLAFGVSPSSAAASQNRSPYTRPALALVGSASETTRQQLTYAQTNHELNIIRLDPARMIQNDTATELKRVGAALLAALDSGQDVALVVNASRQEVAATQKIGAALGLTPAQVGGRIVQGLAETGRRLVQESRISGIVATGGDTANALCNALDAQALEILGEVEAGIPILRLLGQQSLPLVTKAGGFGSPAAMVEALKNVKQYA